jgi:hypothetical protein
MSDDDPLAESDEQGADDDRVDEIRDSAEAAANRIHAAIGSVARKTGAATATFFGRLLSPVPFSGRIWRGMAKRGLYNYYRTSGADRIGLELGPNGKMQLTPVKWLSAEASEEGERAGWHAKGRDESWKATTLGQNGPRLGKTPLVALDTESWKATSILEARVAEAVDQGETRPLYRVDEGEFTAKVDMDDPTGDMQAVADGGAGVTEREFKPKSSPIFRDMIIDLGSDEYDGQAVSWWKTKELLAETTTQEEMANQETRGELMGRSRDELKSMIIKVMLIGGAVALGGLVGPELVAALFGNGGGGSVVPIFTGAV